MKKVERDREKELEGRKREREKWGGERGRWERKGER